VENERKNLHIKIKYKSFRVKGIDLFIQILQSSICKKEKKYYRFLVSKSGNKISHPTRILKVVFPKKMGLDFRGQQGVFWMLN